MVCSVRRSSRPAGSAPRRGRAAPCRARCSAAAPPGPASWCPDQVDAVHLGDLLDHAVPPDAKVHGLAGGLAEPVQVGLGYLGQPRLGAAAPGEPDEHLARAEPARVVAADQPVALERQQQPRRGALGQPGGRGQLGERDGPGACTTSVSSRAARSTAWVPLGLLTGRCAPSSGSRQMSWSSALSGVRVPRCGTLFYYVILRSGLAGQGCRWPARRASPGQPERQVAMFRNTMPRYEILSPTRSGCLTAAGAAS